MLQWAICLSSLCMSFTRKSKIFLSFLTHPPQYVSHKLPEALGFMSMMRTLEPLAGLSWELVTLFIRCLHRTSFNKGLWLPLSLHALGTLCGTNGVREYSISPLRKRFNSKEKKSATKSFLDNFWCHLIRLPSFDSLGPRQCVYFATFQGLTSVGCKGNQRL